MIKYKLTMVEERKEQPEGARFPAVTYHEVCCIGYFNNEETLAKWAEESNGELAKAEVSRLW